MIIISKDITYAYDLAKALSFKLKYSNFYYFRNHYDFLLFEKSIELNNSYDKIVICSNEYEINDKVRRFKYIILHSTLPILNGYATRIEQYTQNINTRTTRNICFKYDKIDKIVEKINSLLNKEDELILDLGHIYLIWHARTSFKSKENLASLIIKSLKENNKECIYVPFNSLLDIDPLLLSTNDNNNSLDIFFQNNMDFDKESFMSFLQKNGRNALGALTFKPQYHLEDFFIFEDEILNNLFNILYRLAKEFKINIIIDFHTILTNKFKNLFQYISRLYFYPIDDYRLETAWKIELNKIRKYVDKNKIMSSIDMPKFNNKKINVKKVS